jgi:hypothetical protein
MSHRNRILALGGADVEVVTPDIPVGFAAVVRTELSPGRIGGDDDPLAVDDGDLVFQAVEHLPEVTESGGHCDATPA